MTIGTISEKEILGLYSPSGVFELKKFWAVRHEEKDPCCSDPFADVTYYILIWRRPEFFLFNYIQPAVLINVLALFVFLIPAESGEKITLGISTMLNMIVFLMTIMVNLPPTEDIPIISIYYAFTMILTTAATVLGVISLRIHHNGQRGVPVSPRLRAVARWLAALSFSHYPMVERQMDNITKGCSHSKQYKDKYIFNIRDQNCNPRTTWSNALLSFPSGSTNKRKGSRTRKPVCLPKVNLRMRRTKLYNSTPSIHAAHSDFSSQQGLMESSSSSEDENFSASRCAKEALDHDKARSLWKKVMRKKTLSKESKGT